MTSPVFITSNKELEAAAVGQIVFLGGEEGRHARKVQRLRPGEPVDLVDGDGLRVRGVVAESNGADAGGEGAAGLWVHVEEILREEAVQPSLILVQALAKGGRDEQAVEMATEVGVDEVVPWEAGRSIVRWRGTKAKAGAQRWLRVATAAAKQARRARIPRVHAVVDSRGLSDLVRRWAEGGSVILVCHETAQEQLSAVLQQLSTRLELTPSVAVIIGPEGGISDEELASLERAGAQIVRLGTSVMRASTAGPAALVALNLSLNRW